MDRLFPETIDLRSPRLWVTTLLLLFLAAVPIWSHVFDEPFYLTQYGRIMVYAIAASALNLLIGYTGLVSFGHALFLALGAYSVAILDFHGVSNAWVQLAAGIGATALVALLTGLVVLRTRGMGFIMITLAFAQMFFFLGISLKHYGGDDGIRLSTAGRLAPLDLGNATQLYYLTLALLLALLFFTWRLVHSRFGYVLRGIQANERRITALGYPVLRFKLAAWVLSALIAAVAGFLLAHLTSYASPSYAAWNVSGELIVIVMLGGIGTVMGPLVGALVLLLVEEQLASLTVHWMAPLGISIVLVVLLARQGLYGALHAWSTRRERIGHDAAKPGVKS